MPPVSTRKPITQRPDGALGAWRDGAFHFDSPEAEQQWTVDAYRKGVHADNWHLGAVLDDKTRDVVLSGLGGATAPVYRGPDGSYRFANVNTVEPADVRALRQKSFQGAKLQDLKGPAMPGEDLIAARFAAGRAANDNMASAANDNAAPAAPQPKKGIGRFAAMAEAQKDASHPSPQEVLQAIDDGIRLFANGATIGYADNAAAAANALFGDGSFAEDYEKNLSEEKGRTEAARARTGTVGAFIEAAPGMIPGYGDALTLVGDAKQYIEHPETATLGNIMGTVFTALPMTPNALGAARKIENATEDAARLEAKVAKTAKPDDIPVQAIDPHETRFSQETVSYEKQRKGNEVYTYDDITNSMTQNGWQGDAIDVVRMPDGKLTTADNTRIRAARESGISAQARVRDFDAPISRREAKRFKHGQKGLPQTWGEAVQRRIKNQSEAFGQATPYGSSDNPRLTYPEQRNTEVLK